VVKTGETLGVISQKVFGTTKHWKKIQDANRTTIPDPARMRPGVRLRLPDVTGK
jgi:nucleoid-associated protein YgaU